MKLLQSIVVTLALGAGGISTYADSAAPTGTNAVLVAPKPVWVSSAAAGLTLTRGNSDLLLFTAKVQTDRKTPANEWLLESDAAYGKASGVENADSLHGSVQYNQTITERFYGFGNVDALNDGLQDLHYRIMLNPGAGYYFIKDKTTDFVGEVGPGAVTEKLGGRDENYLSFRLSEHFDQKLSETAKLWEKAEFIPQVDNLSNYIVNSEIGVQTAISKKLSLQVTLDDAYDNEPAAGRKKNDVKLISGIAYTF